MKLPIYMDYQATTPLDPRVLARMLPYLQDNFGNAASHGHAFGWAAAEAVEVARGQVAAALACEPREVVFVSGATEANNLALFGVMEPHAANGGHLVTQATEHKSVLETCAELARRGCAVTYLPVDLYGRVDPQAVHDAITDKTVLVSLMHVNNEVGTIQPLAEVGALCRKAGVLLHSDVVQSIGKLPLDVQGLQVDLAALSAHKICGPKGVGALYVRRRNPRVRLHPMLWGGGHEAGLRSGTLNVPGIVGLGEACRLSALQQRDAMASLQALRDRLWARLRSGASGLHLNGHPTLRHPGNLHITFDDVQGDALLMSLRDVAVSSGSACTTDSPEPSHVLRAMGVSDPLARSAIRFSLGCFNTGDEVDYVADLVLAKLAQVRASQRRYGT